MLKNAFTSLLILLIALQSSMVMADEHQHQSHQSGSQHQEFDHSHQHSDFAQQLSHSEAIQPVLAADDVDCHHCCHCHSVQLGSLSVVTPSLLPPSQQLIVGHDDSVPSAPHSVLFRPPII